MTSKAVIEPNCEELLQKEMVIRSNNKQRRSWYETASLAIFIIDCGAISNIDTMGIEAIKEVRSRKYFSN